MTDRVVNWQHIKEVWDSGAEALASVANDYGLTLPEVALQANKDGWGDRGSANPLCPSLAVEILTDNMVTIAHKTDLGRLRLLASTVMEQLQYETDPTTILKTTERLTKIYAQIIPLERKVYGMEGDTEEMPDGIVVNIKGKRVNVKSKSKPEPKSK